MRSTSMYWDAYQEAKAEGRAKAFTKYVRCGVDCGCNGGRGHGPYRYARFWDREGKTCRTVYVGKGRESHKIRQDKVVGGVKGILDALSS